MTSREWTDSHRRAHGDFGGEDTCAIAAGILILVGMLFGICGWIIHVATNVTVIEKYIHW